MQKKILSLILAFVLVFGSTLPLGAVLPAAEAQAATDYQYHAVASTVYVSTYEELRTAVKYATDNQTIMLQSDINEVSGHPTETYGDLEFTVDGTVVLDMNGCSIRLGSKNTITVFNITGKTKLHIINSRIDENDSDINFVPQNKVVVYNMLRSVICVNNAAAELYIYNGIHLILEENTNLTDSDSLVALLIYAIGRLEVMGEIESVPTIWAQPKGSDGIFFWGDPRDPDTFVNTSVFLRSGVISAHGNSVRADELSTSSFKEFKLATRLTAYGSDSNADRLYVDYSTDMTLADLSLTEGTFVAAGENLSASASVTKLMVNDCKDVYFYPAATCTHSSSENIPVLSYAGGHFDLCLKCQATLLKSDHEADATVPCTKCGLTKLQNAPDVAVLDEENMIEVATFAQFRDALRSNRSNVTVRLTADIFDASWSSVNRAEPIVLASYGNVIIDLNGHTLGATTEENTALLVLDDNYANDAGFANLVIMNSASKTGTLVNMLGNLIQLDNEKSSLTILPRVNLTVADVGESDSAIIVARNFAKLRMYDCEIKNINGYGIYFDNTSARAYENSVVDTCYLTITSGNSCFSFGSGAFTSETFFHFSLGMASFNVPAGSDVAIMQCNSQTDVKWSNLIKYWYDKKTQENKGYILAENIVEIEDALVNHYKGQNVSILTYGTFADCNEHDNANSFEYLLRDAEAHYASCHKCGRIERTAHTKVSSCKQEDAIQCACGMHEYALPHALAPMTAREATCGEKGVKEGYYRCINRGCGKYFADANGKKEVSADEVYIPTLPHTLNYVEGYGPEYPSCTDNCILAHYHCSKCERMFADENGTTELTEAEVYFTGAHDFEYFTNKYPTCEDYGVIEHKWCRNCNQYFAPDGSIGKQEDFFIEPNGHGILEYVPYEAECCFADGNEAYYVCPDCDKMFADADAKEELQPEAVIIPAIGHHDLVFNEKLDPGCETSGHEAYYECQRYNCGKLFEDAEGTKEVTEEDIYIHYLTHTMLLQEEKAPTCTEDGCEQHYYCLNCGGTFSGPGVYVDSTVEKLGHDYVDGVCTRCGEKETTVHKGDVDGNGKIEAADARLALRVAVGLETLTEEQTLAADVDGTPGLSSSDARLILRVSVGLESFS